MGMRMLLTEHRMLERYRARYGDVFAIAVWPFDPLVVVADPAEVRRIFTGDPVTSGPRMPLPSPACMMTSALQRDFAGRGSTPTGASCGSRSSSS